MTTVPSDVLADGRQLRCWLGARIGRLEPLVLAVAEPGEGELIILTTDALLDLSLPSGSDVFHRLYEDLGVQIESWEGARGARDLLGECLVAAVLAVSLVNTSPGGLTRFSAQFEAHIDQLYETADRMLARVMGLKTARITLHRHPETNGFFTSLLSTSPNVEFATGPDPQVPGGFVVTESKFINDLTRILHHEPVADAVEWATAGRLERRDAELSRMREFVASYDNRR